MAASLSASLLGMVTGFLRQMPLFLIGFVFMIVSSFAIAADYDGVTKFLLRQLPRSVRPLMFDIKDFLVSCVSKIIKAYSIIMLITFAELSVGLWALRVEGFWKFAAVIALCDMLPLVGSGAFLVPWGIVFPSLQPSDPRRRPADPLRRSGRDAQYHRAPRSGRTARPAIPPATLAAMFLGLRIFGLLGMLLAPVIALLLRYLNNTGKVRLYRR